MTLIASYFKCCLALLFVTKRFNIVDAVKCLSCPHIVQPRDCNKVTECGSHEQCYMKRYITQSGTEWFDVGCLDNLKCSKFSFGGVPPGQTVGKRGSDVNVTSPRDTHHPPVIGKREDNGDVVTCEHCCNGTLCNNGGYCGAKVLNYPGPVCYSCKEAQKADGCDQIIQCGADQECFVGQVLNPVSQEFRWTHGCRSSYMCTHNQTRRATKDGKVCDDCCGTHLCNEVCTNYVDWNAQETTPSASGSGSGFASSGTNIPIKTTGTTLPTTTLDPFLMLDCNFERDICNWHQSTSDHGDWRVLSGPTATQFTGPSVDHTYNSDFGHYLYLEASDLYYEYVVRLESDYLKWPTQSCLNLWYHMHGQYIGNLDILIEDRNGNKTKLWSQSGDQGDQWKAATVTLPNTPGRIVIDGYRGADIYGDIALDDIKLTNCKS